MHAAMEVLRSLTLLLAAGSALAATLCLGGMVSARLDMLSHFVPFFLLAGLTALFVHLATHRPGDLPTLILALAAITICAGLMAPELIAALTAGRAAPTGQVIKVIQFNLWGSNADPVATAQWIAAQDADIVVVEEVIYGSAGIPQMVAKTYPYRTTCAPPQECTTYILSKERPTAEGAYPSPDSEGKHSGAWARFGAGDRAFAVMGLHKLWPAPPGPQQAQSRYFAKASNAFDRSSLIVAGDFNSTPWSFSLRQQGALLGLERRSRFLFSWPVQPYSRHKLLMPFSLMPIDHIFAGKDWRTVSVQLGPRLGSDHLPVVAVLARP
jgi:endonuclease/exonuclease/phosphatase (EEP) superfamily protein YafD